MRVKVMCAPSEPHPSYKVACPPRSLSLCRLDCNKMVVSYTLQGKKQHNRGWRSHKINGTLFSWTVCHLKALCKREVNLSCGSHGCLSSVPGGSVIKNLPANVGDAGLISGWRRSFGEGNGNPLQYSCLRNPRQSLAGCRPWSPKSQTQLSNYPSSILSRFSCAD